MLLRSSHGLFTRHTYFHFNYVQEFLWTSELNLIYIRPSDVFRRWKWKNLLFVNARSLCGLGSKEGLFCPEEFEDRTKGDAIISSNTFSSKCGSQSFSGSRPIGLRLHPQVVHIKKSKTSFRRLLSHSFSSSESGEAAMRGWIVSIAKAKGTHDWRQFWSSGRRTHMGHSHGHDHDHGPHEKLGAYGEKILRWGLWSDIFLTIGKVAAGYVSGSTAIIADAAHSASDIALARGSGCWLLTCIIWLRF
ncbi:hypothetical protein KC19_11G160900 [Ceratodon purpureus]|uniref:Uncharacterized protein n=1 Tax=Ceratodon purpureus TaxID=3225 RepID=A0A8T0GH22_CERPU|nr:hypothetical protein KC19_11G160900 [Ceratodon purpureus]